MTPDQEQKLNLAVSLLAELVGDRITLRRHVQIFDGRNIQTGITTGTKIGTSTSQKIGFWNASPVAQQTAISGPGAGAVASDGTARTAIESILTALRNVGIIAT